MSTRDRPELFLDIIETRTTRDVPFTDRGGAWGTRRSPPPGRGWRILRDRERRTTWVRRSAIPRRPGDRGR